jgi:hypothetical protein
MIGKVIGIQLKVKIMRLWHFKSIWQKLEVIMLQILISVFQLEIRKIL